MGTILDFLRPYQREAVSKVVEEYGRGKRIVILVAPTGSGKTLMSLIVSTMLKMDTLFIVRTRNQVACFCRDAWKFFSTYPGVVLNKSETCLRAEKNSESDDDSGSTSSMFIDCSSCSHYRELTLMNIDELSKTVRKIVQSTGSVDPYIVASFLKKRKICPYQAMQLAGHRQWLVMTYPYIAKPFLRKILREKYLHSENTLIVIDEAHNLEDAVLRGIGGLSEKTITVAEKELNELTGLLSSRQEPGEYIDIIDEAHSYLNTLRTWLSSLRTSKPEEESIIDPPDIDPEAYRVFRSLAKTLHDLYLEARGKAKTRIALHTVSCFLSYCTSCSRDGMYVLVWTGSRVEVRLSDPGIIASILDTGKVLLMSGTMPPLDYIHSVWGIRKSETSQVKVNVKIGEARLYIVNNLSSKMEYRKKLGEELYARYADAITRIYNNATLHVLSVFPSYDFMYRTYRYLVNKIAHSSILLEKEDTRIGHVEQVAREAHRLGKRLLICAVAGGKLCEGVELVSEDGRSLLSDIVVAGCPYPKPTQYLQHVYARIARRSGVDPHYVSTIKMIMRTRQALGRGTRHPEDHCRWWLLDYRYSIIVKNYPDMFQ